MANLPPEVLILIFQYLRRTDLMQVRLTCSSWNSIVCGTRILINNFRLLIKISNVEQCCELSRSRTTKDSIFRRVFVDFINTELSDPLWPWLGPQLRDLSLKQCFVTTELLMAILKLSPQLNRLSLHTIELDDFQCIYGELNFRLECLETLELHSMFIDSECLELFRRICPRLKHLKIKHSSLDDEDDNELVKFVGSVQDTLESLNLSNGNLESAQLNQIVSHSRLKLKKLSISTCLKLSGEDIVNVTKLQPTIVRLNVNEAELDDSMLKQITKNLPNLRRIKLASYIVDDFYASFLKRMTNLHYLAITEAHFVLNLGTYVNTQLRDLHLFNAKFLCKTLPQCIAQCPNIRSFTLNNCLFEDPDDQVTVYRQLKRLKRWNRQCSLEDDCDCTLNLSAAIHWCPQLEEVIMNDCTDVTDDLVEELCQAKPHLKYLNLDGCSGITDDSIRPILAHCLKLETLSIRYAKHVSDDAILRLKRAPHLQTLNYE